MRRAGLGRRVGGRTVATAASGPHVRALGATENLEFCLVLDVSALDDSYLFDDEPEEFELDTSLLDCGVLSGPEWYHPAIFDASFLDQCRLQ